MSSKKQIDFIFDFASPNAYLSYHALKKLLPKEVNIHYIFCLLGGMFKLTNNQAPMIAFAHIPNKLNYMSLEIKRFIEKYKLDHFKMNTHFPVMTLLIQRIGVYLAIQNKEKEYINVMLKAMWEDNKKCDDPDVVKTILSDAGFDANACLLASQDQAIKDQLAKNTQNCVDKGCFGIPSFLLRDELFFGKDSLPVLLEHLELL